MHKSVEGQRQALMVEVNKAIDRLHASLTLGDSDFFCECGHTGCKERITLTRAEYASLRDESRLVVVAHHSAEDSADTVLRELRGQVHQLQEALESRVNIEQAKGVLVERQGMTPDQAFEALRQRARDQRRSLDEVCAQLIGWAATSAEEPPPAPSAELRRLDRESHGR